MVGRILLLLLLASDWALDPCQGTSASSSCLASTETDCECLRIQAAVQAEFAMPPFALPSLAAVDATETGPSRTADTPCCCTDALTERTDALTPIRC